MPNARVIGSIPQSVAGFVAGFASPGVSSAQIPPSNVISLADVQKMIADAVAQSTAAFIAKQQVPAWEPSPAEFVPGQQAYAAAPPYTKGAQYWKPGTKHESLQ